MNFLEEELYKGSYEDEKGEVLLPKVTNERANWGCYSLNCFMQFMDRKPGQGRIFQ